MAVQSLSSCQLARDLDLNQKTAWYILTRIRAEMAHKVNSIMLTGIIEADETFIGGKPRKENKKEDREHASRGRGNSVEYTPLYVFERCYVYNNRYLETMFWKFINNSMILPSKEG